jgi:hypothetical protein
MNIDLKGVLTAIFVTAGVGYVFLTGEQPPQPWKLFEQDEKASFS